MSRSQRLILSVRIESSRASVYPGSATFQLLKATAMLSLDRYGLEFMDGW